jgi:predicted RNA-binding Zn-ribbon protein involved in translation (DUF1610 family)
MGIYKTFIKILKEKIEGTMEIWKEVNKEEWDAFLKVKKIGHTHDIRFITPPQRYYWDEEGAKHSDLSCGQHAFGYQSLGDDIKYFILNKAYVNQKVKCSCTSCGSISTIRFNKACEEGCPECGSFEIEIVDKVAL